MQGAIPTDWGQSGSFPNLQKMGLSFNHELNGTLPATWGSDGSSLQNLTELHLTNDRLSGPLPSSWAGNLPALQVLNLSANELTGALFSVQQSRLLQVHLLMRFCAVCKCACQYHRVSDILHAAI